MYTEIVYDSAARRYAVYIAGERIGFARSYDEAMETLMPEYTTTEAAALLGTAHRNVQNYAKRHELRKFGREYVITELDIEGMRGSIGKPGRRPARATTGG